MFIVMFCAGSCGAAERVALMLEGADPKALPNSFNGLCYSGLEKARERYGRKIQTKVYNSYGDDNILAPLLRSASSESDLVIITSALYIPALKEMKKDFPECSYIVFDSRDIKGVTNIIFREEEGGIDIRIVAAMMTRQSGIERINDELVVGIILGEKVPPAQRFHLGYKAGSWYASPEVEVLCEYTGSFVDGSRVEAAAAKLSAKGADVIFCAAGPRLDGRDTLRRTRRLLVHRRGQRARGRVPERGPRERREKKRPRRHEGRRELHERQPAEGQLLDRPRRGLHGYIDLDARG